LLAATEFLNRTISRGTRRGPKLLLLIGSVVVSLALAEVIARLVGWGDVVLFSPNNKWGFLMKPSQLVYTYGIPVRINSLGLRGPEVSDPKPSNCKRIVFIGDSVTYGGGHIPEQKLFCRRVESQARCAGINVEVVNVSAPAWSPQNWWAYVQANGLHDADLVVLVLPECDLTRMFSTMEMGGHWDRAPSFRLTSLARKVLSRFRHEQLTADKRVEVEDVIAANLSAVKGLREKCGHVPFVAVLVPTNARQLPAETIWPQFTASLPETVDLREALQNPTFFLDGAHLSVPGHALVADRVFARIQPLLTNQVTLRGFKMN
jgi:hypothetical protein